MNLHYNKRNLELRAPSGNITAGETTVEIDSRKYEQAVVDLRVTELIMPDGDDEVDFYIQTEINGTWVDVANVHFDNGDEPIAGANRLIGIGPKAAGVDVITPTDGTLPDNTAQDLPLGEAVRIKTKVTGATAPTYAYEARLTLLG